MSMVKELVAVANTAARMKKAEIEDLVRLGVIRAWEPSTSWRMAEAAYIQARAWYEAEDPWHGWARQMSRNSYTVDPKEPEQDLEAFAYVQNLKAKMDQAYADLRIAADERVPA